MELADNTNNACLISDDCILYKPNISDDIILHEGPFSGKMDHIPAVCQGVGSWFDLLLKTEQLFLCCHWSCPRQYRRSSGGCQHDLPVCVRAIHRTARPRRATR